MKEQNKTAKSGRGRGLRGVLAGDMLGSRWVMEQLPLLVLIVVMCLVLVAVRYRVESLNKEKERLQKEVGYLREQRMQMRKRYQESIRISRIDEELDTVGIGLVAGPPYELKVE